MSKLWLIEWKAISLDRKIELGIIALGTGIAIAVMIFGWRQLGFMSEQTAAMQAQLTEMQKAGAETKSVVDSLKEIAQSTQSSIAQGKAVLDATLEASRLDHRAWVGTMSVKNPQIKAGTPLGLQIEYRNMGKTPARKLTVLTAWRYMPADQQFAPLYSAPERKAAVAVLLPQMQGWSDLSDTRIVLNQEQIDRLREGTSRLYVFGKFTYRTLDIDGGGTSCMILSRNLNGAPEWCDTYNEIY